MNFRITSVESYRFRKYLKGFVGFGIFVLFLSISVFSQSTDQNLPTPVVSNQISGQIKARDIGDSRLTTFYYVFNGDRGDIFINIVTSNLNGDIDIFSAGSLDPKTKITIYADSSQNETGRVIYLRKPEKLILRIQGRTPNDDPATFQIKFAGSFVPLEGIAETETPDLPEVRSNTQGAVKVNSVGTIIEEEPKPTPETKTEETVAKDKTEEAVAETTDDENVDEETDTTEPKTEETVAEKKEEPVKPEISPVFDPTKKVEDIIRETSPAKKPSVLITDPFGKTDANTQQPKTDTEEPAEKNVTIEVTEKPSETSAIVTIERVEEDEAETAEPKTEEANPLAKIFLKVELKNGERFERPMSDVLSMNVIKGVLTIVTNDGKIQQISILDVVKMTIE